MKNMIRFLFIAIGFIGTLHLQAQPLIEEVLKEPIQRAIEESAALQNAAREGQLTAFDKAIARAKKQPQISAFAGYGYLYSQLNSQFPTHYLPVTGTPLLEDPFVSAFQTQAVLGGLSARQVIFTGLQINKGMKALEEKKRAEELLAEAQKVEIAQEVVTTFDQVMLLSQVQKLIEDSEKRLDKAYQKVLRGIANGLAVPYDRDKLKLALLELEEKQVELEGNRELLYDKLEYLTGMTLSDLKLIAYELQPFLLEHTERTAEKRLELRALEAGKRAKEFAYEKEKGAKWPTLFAFGNLSYVNAFDSRLKLRDLPLAGDVKVRAEHLRLEPATVLGVGLKWDLFKGGAVQQQIKKAALDREISETQLADTRKKLDLLVKKSQVDFYTVEKRLAVANQQLKVAQNNLRLANEQYAAGLVDLTERLASENDFFKVNFNYYNQILEQRASALSLMIATGEVWEKMYDQNE